MRLVQFELRNGERRVGVVQGNTLREVHTARSVRELALAAIDAGAVSYTHLTLPTSDLV